MNWKWLFVLVLLLLLVIFTTQNYEVAEIRFLFWAFKTSRAIIIFATLFIGVIIGWLTALLKER